MFRVPAMVIAQLDLRLLFFAGLIAACAALVSLHTLGHGRDCRGRARGAWLALAGATAAAGFWATNFLAIRAYEWGAPTAYHPGCGRSCTACRYNPDHGRICTRPARGPMAGGRRRGGGRPGHGGWARRGHEGPGPACGTSCQSSGGRSGQRHDGRPLLRRARRLSRAAASPGAVGRVGPAHPGRLRIALRGGRGDRRHPRSGHCRFRVGRQRSHVRHRRGMHHGAHHGHRQGRNAACSPGFARGRARPAAPARPAGAARGRAEPAESALRHGADKPAAGAVDGGCRAAPRRLQQAVCGHVRHSARADEARHAHQRAGGTPHRQRHLFQPRRASLPRRVSGSGNEAHGQDALPQRRSCCSRVATSDARRRLDRRP